MKAAMSAAPIALGLPSGRRWLAAFATWLRESSREVPAQPAALFDACTTDALSRAAIRRAQWLRDAR